MKPSYHGFKQAHPGKIVCDPETKINSEAELWFHVHLWMWHCLNFANNSHQRSARYSEWTKAAFCLDSHSVRDSTEVLGFKWLLHHTHNIREEKNRNVINTSDFYSLQLLELFRKIITRITAAVSPVLCELVGPYLGSSCPVQCQCILSIAESVACPLWSLQCVCLSFHSPRWFPWPLSSPVTQLWNRSGVSLLSHFHVLRVLPRNFSVRFPLDYHWG